MHGRWQRAAPWVAGACLLVTFGLAYAEKAACVGGESGFWETTRYCYSDVRVLWSFRGFDVDAVPYAGPPEGYQEDYTFEYPPGMAFPAYLIGLGADTRTGFFNLHALSFAAAVAAALWAADRTIRTINRDGELVPRSRWRILGLALSPGLVLFGLQNWDLWPVALVALGLASAARRRPDVAAAWFGLGAATKWWPALLVIVVIAGPWSRADERGRGSGRLAGFDLRPAGVAAAIWAAVQIPALVISPSGWWEAIRFHLGRPANLDSAASAIASFGRYVAPGRFWGDPFMNAWTVVSFAVLLWGIWHVADRLRDRRLDPGDAALALVALFLLTSKVFSPQFILWLLPVAVVSSVRWTPVLSVESANAAVWLLYGPWMAQPRDAAFSGFLRAAQGAAVVRAAAVAWLLAATLWRDRLTVPVGPTGDGPPDDRRPGGPGARGGPSDGPRAASSARGEQPHEHERDADDRGDQA